MSTLDQTDAGVRPAHFRLLRHAAISGVASFGAIFVLGAFDAWLVDAHLVALIGSFGATAVLVYAAPDAEFSRFRNVVGGHVLSAVVGVLVAMAVTDLALAAGISVGLAVATMVMTHTVHPPGGATALIAVVGGDRVADLGFGYVLSPVLLGALAMYSLGVAIRLLGTLGSDGWERG